MPSSGGNLVVRLLGYRATLIFGDTAVYDRWRFLKRHIQHGQLRTMDAGAGSGAMSLWAAKCGNRVVGVSLSARDNDIARQRAQILGLPHTEFVTGDLRKLDELANGWEPFDQVICFEVIEHIKDDRKLLRDLAGVMKPGARLIFTTPYKNYHPLPGDGITDIEDGSHVRWGYTHEEMRSMLEEAGFEVKAQEYVTGFFSQLVLRIQRWIADHGAGGKLAWLVTLPLRPLQLLDPMTMRHSDYPALSIGVIAAKK